MNKNAPVIFMIVICALAVTGVHAPASAEGAIIAEGNIAEDSLAPNFTLRDGNGTTLAKADIAGRIIVCFYETDKTSETNGELKTALAKAIERVNVGDKAQNIGLPFVLAVADCSGAKPPFIAFWESALRGKSKKIGYTLWGDWDGKMREDYRFTKDEANFALVDRDGRIRCKTSGKVDDKKIAEISTILISLMENAK